MSLKMVLAVVAGAGVGLVLSYLSRKAGST